MSTNYYIASGLKNKMYTLRVSFEETVYTRTGDSYIVLRDHYCTNLSIDHAKAYAKAEEYVRHQSGSLVAQSEVPTLEDIYRRSQEELEIARKLAEETAQAAQAEYEGCCCQARMDKIDMIVSGLWPFGKYKGEAFKAAEEGYVLFFLELDNDSDDTNHRLVLESLQNALKAEYPHLLNLPTANGQYYGTVKSREDMELTLITAFGYDSMYGYISIQKFVKDSGELIMYKGTSPLKADIGETIKVKATVKEHSEYKGEIQTIIQRPKFLAA